MRPLFGVLCLLALALPALAHDPWVQANARLVRAGDYVHVDLMLGNHGNEHRDFKLAGKVDLTGSTLTAFAPGGKKIDLKPALEDAGYAPKEGFWTARLTASEPGLYLVAHTGDRVVSYAPLRSISSAKTYLVASKSLDKPPADAPGFDRPLGHALELVPVTGPVLPTGPGVPVKVRLLFKGKPLAGARVSFVPRGVTLADDFDERYERRTDAKGEASFTPADGNRYLIVAHHKDDAAGKGHKGTKYSATLTVLVPQVRP